MERLLFQSTLPRGERRNSYGNANFLSIVSIHAPTRGATPLTYEAIFPAIVSIHAPTRGATIMHNGSNISLVVSIHAPTRGATSLKSLFPHCSQFQSTLPRGERHCAIATTAPSWPVSIHAPTRGATSFQFHGLPLQNCFNPRSHEGSDIKLQSP